METGKIQEGAQDLTTRLISLKSSEVHEAIGQYFSQTAALDSRYLKVIGRDRLERQADLFNQGFSKSTLVNKPTVDDDEHTIAFTVKRQVDTSKLFYLVKHIPFVGRLATSDQEMHFDAKITLSPSDQSKKDDSSTLYVSKIWIDSQEKAPLIARLIFNTTQPLHKPIAVVVARVAEIVMDQPNPVSPSGILGLAFHTTGALTGWTIGKLHDAGGSVLSHIPGFQKVSHMVTNPDWLPDSQSQLPDWSNKAMASAVNLGHSAEARAQKMGVPVDQARDTFYKAVDEVEQRFHLQSKGQELKDKAEKGAHDLADQVRTTTTSPDIDRGEHERFDSQDEEEEEEEVEDVKTPLGKNKPLAEEPSSQAADDKDAGEEPVNHLADVPTTPLGGHDPLANNAPSYAVAVAEGEETSHDDQVDDHTNDQVDEPADGATTPFGGHDPLASNAASYAKATEKGDHPDKSAAQDSDVPTTPLGGHDPLAANAPSYAKAAEVGAHPETQSNDAPSAGQQAQSETDYLQAGTKQHHQEEEYDGATTPFGGHDPLAAGAPSFAQAAAN